MPLNQTADVPPAKPFNVLVKTPGWYAGELLLALCRELSIPIDGIKSLDVQVVAGDGIKATVYRASVQAPREIYMTVPVKGGGFIWARVEP